MDEAQALLFDDYPRRVGTPSQHWVFNEAQVDVFLDTIRGSRNAYATLGRLPLDGSEVCDKVLFDLDSPAKSDTEGEAWALFDDDPSDLEAIDRMRHDPDTADAVLGDACEDAQDLTRASLDDGIPVVGVFTGFGIHIHQLYQPTEDPATAMTTCAAKYIDELGLQTPDWAILGQTERLCRMPNAQRCTMPGPRHVIEDGRATGLYQVPLTAAELCEVSPEWLLDASTSPRVPADLHPDDRPTMPIWEEYRGSSDGSGEERPQRPVNQRTAPIGDEFVEALLTDLLQMPCMVERALSPNPAHEVRLNVAVLLFNVGLNVQQVENLLARLNWVDFDREYTRKILEQIYDHGYSDMTCASLQERGLCVKADSEECHCYGWSGGQAEWKQ